MKKWVGLKCVLILMLFLGGCKNIFQMEEILGKYNKETLLEISNSPGKSYTVEIYRTDPHATVDYSIKAYIVKNKTKEMIYNVYHEYEAEVIWLSEHIISINGRNLDLSIGEKYDWRITNN